jgi:AcrR family transcriptional regulator
MDAAADLVASSALPPRKTRSTERTRRAVLDAAFAAVAERGTGVSLAHVAELAGVSKSGLLHHFGSREQLFIAVVDDANERFRGIIEAHLEPDDDAPGRWLRAYVRALCGGSDEAARYFDTAPAWNGLFAVPGVSTVMEQDAAWWSTCFAADGVDSGRVQIIRRAAEGIAAAWCFGEETRDSVVLGGEALLRMTRHPGPIGSS